MRRGWCVRDRCSRRGRVLRSQHARTLLRSGDLPGEGPEARPAPPETARFRSGSGAASPGTFGHGGAAGQIAWADPATGLSFAYLTNGSDRNAVRQSRRVRELAPGPSPVSLDRLWRAGHPARPFFAGRGSRQRQV
ncbi:serine hydrolase [Nonomuraea basaltis]|uniref:serine hydrolase n=1 Tax=Nonomuraea basaltis TaxID=2495887 RepID=UPI001980FC67